MVGDPANAVRIPSPCEMTNEWPVHLWPHFDPLLASDQALDIPKESVAKVTVRSWQFMEGRIGTPHMAGGANGTCCYPMLVWSRSMAPLICPGWNSPKSCFPVSICFWRAGGHHGPNLLRVSNCRGRDHHRVYLRMPFFPRPTSRRGLTGKPGIIRQVCRQGNSETSKLLISESCGVCSG